MTEPKYDTLSAAMQAGDELAEAVLRYEMLDESFRDAPARERKSLSVELNGLMEKITRLRANPPKPAAVDPERPADEDKFGKVVPFDASRFRKDATP